MFDEKKIGNFIITKHISAINTSNFVELSRSEISNLRLSECHFVELCPNLKNYSYQNNSLQHIYLEALKHYYKGDWQAANSSLEKMIRFMKDFVPANNLKKRLMSHGFSCPADWVSYLKVNIRYS